LIGKFNFNSFNGHRTKSQLALVSVVK